ncbi:hypothetical protein KW830_08725 [Comamonas sp. CMM03]|uniref:hypothetical protein n=1 Tax=Comamonas sp. CMM03 TaxID=2854781 RepID=UPI001C45F58F|nr:hypothetical protein [Comamonas sp. CMM03]MBV7418541.1 hypothetical protein [Comamonas sp. CMM03]
MPILSPSSAPSPTSSTAAQPTPQLFCIHPGQAHALVVPAGSEVFCSHGSLLLHSGPQGLVDGAPSLQWQLSTGQRWRAPCLLWLQASSQGGTARLQCSMAPLPASAAPPATPWQRLRTLLRSVGGRRTAAG